MLASFSSQSCGAGEYADSGFYDDCFSDWEIDVDWDPPVNRKRHPAGDGTFCTSPAIFRMKVEDSQGGSPPQSSSQPINVYPPVLEDEPRGAFLLRRFLGIDDTDSVLTNTKTEQRSESQAE